MSKLKTAVVGVGSLGRHHLKWYSKLDNSELVGLYDTDHDRAQQYATEYSVTAFDSLQQLAEKMQLLPYEQREVIILHLKGEMKFKTIANLQDVSINTVQSRYRYGLEKLRSLFNEEITR